MTYSIVHDILTATRDGYDSIGSTELYSTDNITEALSFYATCDPRDDFEVEMSCRGSLSRMRNAAYAYLLLADDEVIDLKTFDYEDYIN